MLAESAALKSIAFPSISTGVYGFPLEQAAPLALEVAGDFAQNHAKNLTKIIFVLFDQMGHDVFQALLET
jgi:O-acetyl-ADP-ribose deacetylase (regulator of RNase III)